MKATAERLDGGGVLFRCEATLTNTAGVELRVRTNFGSVFDGIELLVLGESGEKLHQQPYVYHQSPSSPHGRDLPLKTGETRETLRFPSTCRRTSGPSDSCWSVSSQTASGQGSSAPGR